MAETKLLDYNMKKSGFLVIGGDKERAEIERQLKVSPLTLYNRPVTRKESDKYLGDQISSKGLSDSVKLTVEKRRGSALRLVY